MLSKLLIIVFRYLKSVNLLNLSMSINIFLENVMIFFSSLTFLKFAIFHNHFHREITLKDTDKSLFYTGNMKIKT